jgi:hypothetical protein
MRRVPSPKTVICDRCDSLLATTHQCPNSYLLSGGFELKKTLKILTLFAAFAMLSTSLLYANVTVGTYNTGNCYPFLCNDSGTNVGTTMDYQQAYSHTAFSGPITITNLEFAYAAQFGGSSTMIDGSYGIWLGTSANPFNALSTNQVANRSADWTLVDSLTVSGNGCNFNALCTINLTTPFTYNPANGDLLFEVIASNQANIANGSGNGYLEADSTGALMGRNYCIGASDCANGIVDPTGLVTTFSTGTTVPEPGTLVMFWSGLLGLAGMIRRKVTL